MKQPIDYEIDLTILARAEAAEAERDALQAKLDFVSNCRQWPFYPIEMPLTASGNGPATVGFDAEKITYEVWDQVYNTHACFDNLPDAINEAMRLSFSAIAKLTADTPEDDKDGNA